MPGPSRERYGRDDRDSHSCGLGRRRLAQATFDLLFVNAGVTNGPEETVADVSTDTFVRLMVTNAPSPMRA